MEWGGSQANTASGCKGGRYVVRLGIARARVPSNPPQSDIMLRVGIHWHPVVALLQNPTEPPLLGGTILQF